MGQRSQAPPSRSSFSNPFRKLQTTFGSSGKRSLDLGSSQNGNNFNGTNNGGNTRFDRIVSSSLSAGSLVSWRSRGAEMFSKPWGRNRKNSEPLLKSTAGSMTESIIFGVDLEDAIRLSHIPNTPPVPAVLYRCAEFLEAKGVDEVGLYRIPGSHANVQKLKRIFDTGRDYNLMAMDAIDPNDIATLLKLYLRELPSPLLPPVLLEQFQSLLTTDQHICHTLRSILFRLPRQNYTVLSFLCRHLSKIAAHAENTKMTVSNLGVVFAPTLAIGSVLFRALLGGFYDGVDSPENREMGLKIVWGSLHQDGYGMQEWPEDDEEGIEEQSGVLSHEASDKEKYDGADQDRVQDPYLEQPQTLFRHQQSMPALSPFSDHYANNSTTFFDSVAPKGVGPLDVDDRPDYGQIMADPFSSATSSSSSLSDAAEDEESSLMNAMLQREDMATKAPPPSSPPRSVSKANQSTQEPPSPSSPTVALVDIGGPVTPPSHLTSTATTPSNLNTTSTASGISSNVNKVADLSLSPPPPVTMPHSSQSPSVLNVTIDAGAMPATSTSPSAAPNAKGQSPVTPTMRTSPVPEINPVSNSTSLKSPTGAPQLPPLSRMSISL
ncbi:hypothetical protein EDD21DRAFT_404051 [Dissophora ornata]|nr:hypothetical protein EDD21DRAFT_404051 [Dissophora ornata]